MKNAVTTILFYRSATETALQLGVLNKPAWEILNMQVGYAPESDI